MADRRQSVTAPGTPKDSEQRAGTGRSAMADIFSKSASRTPIRRDSFDRPNGFLMLDSTPRRFSTGAAAVPMPAPQVFAAQLAAEAELEDQNRTMTPKEQQDLSAAISKFSFYSSATPSIARLAALTSPCYFHKRFGDAVDIEKVLDEIKADDQLSHSRLMQTAASVREVSSTLR